MFSSHGREESMRRKTINRVHKAKSVRALAFVSVLSRSDSSVLSLSPDAMCFDVGSVRFGGAPHPSSPYTLRIQATGRLGRDFHCKHPLPTDPLSPFISSLKIVGTPSPKSRQHEHFRRSFVLLSARAG